MRERLERGGGADSAGGGQVVAGDRADFGRGVGQLLDQGGDPLRVVGRGAGGGHAGIGEGCTIGGQFFRAGQAQHALRAELRHDRDALGVGNCEFREFGEDRLRQFGSPQVDEPEDGLDEFARFLAGKFERGTNGRVGFEQRLSGFGGRVRGFAGWGCGWRNRRWLLRPGCGGGREQH